jgi:hypothetical protein
MKTKSFLQLLGVAGLLLFASAVPASAQTQLIQNASFESGNTGAWVLSGGAPNLLISTYAGLAHQGSYYLWLGGDNGSDVAYQTVTIPSNVSAASLSFYYNINTSEPTSAGAYDTFTVKILDNNGNLLATVGNWSNLNGGSPGSYSYQQPFSLLPYAGKTIRIYFGSNCHLTGSGSSAATSNFRVDDVSVTITTINCSYSANPASANPSAGAGSGNFAITAGTGCSWAATTSYNWIHTSSSGTGNGTVNYTVDANPSPVSRIGTIAVGGQTVSITQAAASCAYSISPNSASPASTSGSSTFTIAANSGCSWSATTASSWIQTSSSGSGNGMVNYTYDANTSTSSRTGTIMVAGQSFTIVQAGTGGGLTVPIKQSIIPAGRNNRPAYAMTVNYITIHDTDNSSVGANALMHANYLINPDQGGSCADGSGMPNNPDCPKSWHFTVDDHEIYQHLPVDENGWHAGDGANGTGNRQSIGVEICMNSDGNRTQAEENAAWLTAKLLTEQGLSIDRVKQHNNWSGKNCPSVLRGRTGGWDGFLARVAYFLGSCSYAIAPNGTNPDASSGSGSFAVTAGSGCNWSASTDSSWIHTTAIGIGNGTVNFSYDANTSTVSRTGMITVGGRTYTITQSGTLSTPTVTVPLPGSTFASSSVAFQWTSGTGVTEYFLYVGTSLGANDLYGQSQGLNRSVTVNSLPVDGRRLYVRLYWQIAGTWYATDYTYTAATLCSYSISPGSANPGAGSGSGSFNVTAEVGCSWNAATAFSWIHTTSSGSGNGTISYSCEANTGVNSRSGTIMVGGKTFTITQAGVACTYSISPTTSSPDANGGSGSFSVTTSSACSWTATTSYNWIHTSSSETGNGTVNYTVDANSSSSARTGTIAIGGQTFAITQAGHSSGHATRILPIGYTPGTPLTITINVTPAPGGSSYAVEDLPPSGWSVTAISDSGVVDNVNHKVKWGPFFDANTRSLTYQATPPSNESGTKTFVGTASFDGSGTAIGGNASIDKTQGHPADADANMRMVINEVTAYGSAWKLGTAWSTPPTTIDVNYVTRAGYLWKNGEVYTCDSSQAAPLCWQTPAIFAQASLMKKSSIIVAGTAVRNLPAGYTASGALAVSIIVTPASSASAYAVEDAPPAGWIVNNIDNGGTWDAINHKVKWGPFFDNATRTLGYQATPPAGTSGVKVFSGIASIDGVGVAIGGASSIGNSTVTAQTLAATEVASTSVRLNGSVNPNGTTATIYFEYGPSTNYGNTTASANIGTVAGNYGIVITGLSPNTSYHSRIVAQTSGGTAYANDMTFVTSQNVTPTAGNYQGLFYNTNEVTLESSGFFGATVTSNGTFTAKLQLAGKSYSLSGRFDGGGAFSSYIFRKGMNAIHVSLKFANGGDVLNGEIVDGAWTAELVANRAAFNASTNPAPHQGKYTMVIPGHGNSSTAPAGDGFGTVTVDGSGNVTFNGTLADGTKVSQKTTLSKEGRWAFYASANAGNSLILGWLTLANGSDRDLQGAVDWFKQPHSGPGVYPSGFAVQSETTGSRYVFSLGMPVLNFNTGEIQFENGDLAQSVTNQIALNSTGKVMNLSGNKLNLTITASSGLFKGSFIDPASGANIPFCGVLLQKQNQGSGYFLGTSQSGRVYFGPVAGQ